MFTNVNDTQPKEISLLRWLEGSPRLNGIVDQIRRESDKEKRTELKKQLPAITPSGLFSGRKDSDLIKHSGFIALDFDDCDPQKAKFTLSGIVNVFYAGLSASGRGVWALIPIRYPDHHHRHFQALQADFASLGLQMDTTCKNIARLRFYSYDSNPIFNMDAITYEKLAPIPTYKPPRHDNRDNDSLSALINKVVASKIDITQTYEDWYMIGAALASRYGEGGRSMFHAISQFHPEYNPGSCDRQYSRCLRYTPGVGPGMVFSIAQRYGILLVEK